MKTVIPSVHTWKKQHRLDFKVFWCNFLLYILLDGIKPRNLGEPTPTEMICDAKKMSLDTMTKHFFSATRYFYLFATRIFSSY